MNHKYRFAIVSIALALLLAALTELKSGPTETAAQSLPQPALYAASGIAHDQPAARNSLFYQLFSTLGSGNDQPSHITCPGGPAQCFADVPYGTPFFSSANNLYEQGISSGYTCGGAGEPCDAFRRPYFRPANGVTRGQMTKFVDNARTLPGISIVTSDTVTVPIYARTNTNLTAIFGSSAGAAGVYGSSSGGDGVFGTSANYEGVRGQTTSNYAGVFGTNSGSGLGPGVRGDATSGPGVYGISSGNHGVWGSTSNGGNSGVFGENTASGIGVMGQGYTGIQGRATTSGAGVIGVSASGDGVFGTSSTGPGVIGESSTGDGVYGQSTTGYAGHFAGNVLVEGDVHVTGNCCGSSAGTYRIDDPLDPANKYLNQAAVESSDMLDIYSGNATTDAVGEAVVTLPDYFQALNRDFRYQLTPVGQFAQTMVAQGIKDNSFVIKTDKPNVEVSWQVTGVRQDAYAQAHPVIVEQDKPAGEQGK
jgi:hypothetical protein